MPSELSVARELGGVNPLNSAPTHPSQRDFREAPPPKLKVTSDPSLAHSNCKTTPVIYTHTHAHAKGWRDTGEHSDYYTAVHIQGDQPN